ncbi:MAG: hypothetical protein IT463_09445 [Planctomycetes bacterium]|nr:hypothetical protein [Planctomycetota bacterium]
MKRLIALCLLLLPAAPLLAQEKPAEAGKPVVKTRTVRIENGRVRVEENGKVVEDREVGDGESAERARDELAKLEAEMRSLQRELERLRRDLKNAGAEDEAEDEAEDSADDEDELPAELRRELDRARAELKRVPGGVKLPPEVEEELRKAMEEAQGDEGESVQEFEKSAPDGSWHVKIRIVRRGSKSDESAPRKDAEPAPRKARIGE